MPFIYSTLSNSQAYSLFKKGGADLPIAEQICVIKGGAGISNNHFQTPKGVATEVTKHQLELLNTCDAYLQHKANGYIVEDDVEVAADKVARNMKPKDESAPITPDDFADKEKAPVTNSRKKAK